MRTATLALVALAVGCTGPLDDTRRFRIPNSSMEPTLHCARPATGCLGSQDDLIFTEERDEYERGDIVAFETPPRVAQVCPPGGTHVSRIVGLPGETVGVRNGEVYVNGKKFSQPYVLERNLDFNIWEALRVPSDAYYVLGDNRLRSCDSRLWGTVPASNVIGALTTIERDGRRIDL